MIAPEQLERLQQDWARLFASFGVSLVQAYPLFDQLVAAYSERHRYYHTLEHLLEMFRILNRLADHADDLASLKLAIWFHDAIYDPQQQDNETASAVFAHHQLEALGLPKDIIERVATLILATRHQQPEYVDGDMAILLDVDLAILGASSERYARYAEAIRREYAWLPMPTYRDGRVRILDGFLARDRIYRTELLYQAGEQAARVNLQAERAALKNLRCGI